MNVFWLLWIISLTMLKIFQNRPLSGLTSKSRSTATNNGRLISIFPESLQVGWWKPVRHQHRHLVTITATDARADLREGARGLSQRALATSTPGKEDPVNTPAWPSQGQCRGLSLSLPHPDRAQRCAPVTVSQPAGEMHVLILHTRPAWSPPLASCS